MRTLTTPRRAFAWRSISAPVVRLTAVLLVWQAAIVLFGIPGYLLPGPVAVAGVYINQPVPILTHMGTTAYEVLLSYGLAGLFGIPLGVLIAKSMLSRRLLQPLIVGSQAFPILGVAPLLIVWLGFGVEPKVVVAFLISFFPVVAGTALGLESVKPESILLARSIGLGKLQRFRLVEWPAALPAVFGGLKVATTLAVVGAIVGEFVAASSGLGFLILRATGVLDTAVVFAALIVLALLGISFYQVVAYAERVAMPWRAL